MSFIDDALLDAAELEAEIIGDTSAILRTRVTAYNINTSSGTDVITDYPVTGIFDLQENDASNKPDNAVTLRKALFYLTAKLLPNGLVPSQSDMLIDGHDMTWAIGRIDPIGPSGLAVRYILHLEA